MSWLLPVQAVPLFAAASIAGVVAAIAIRKEDAKGSVPLAVLLAAATLWSMGAGLELVRTELWWRTLFSKVMYVGIALVPPAWLFFVVEYTGREAWITRQRIAVLLVVPAIAIVATLTNDPYGIHTLFWTEPHVESIASGLEYEYGPLFWLHGAYAYLLLALGSYWLLELAAFSEHLYRIQAFGLLLTVLIPWIANGLYLADIVATPYDPTAIGIVLSGVVVMTTVYRHRLLEVVPAARELARTELIETIDDPVVVIDDDRHVVDVNPAATDMFEIHRADAIGRDIDVVSPDLTALLDRDHPEQTTITRDVDNTRRHYDVQITPLSRGYGVVTGQLLALRDITRQHYQRQQLSVMNRLLRHNLRNAITAIRGNAEYVAAETEDEEISERMDVIASNAEDVMAKRDELERVLNALDREERTVGEAETILRTVVEAINDRYPAAHVQLALPEESLLLEGRERLRIAIEELLTNAVVHHDGPTPTVTVSLSADGDTIELVVTDDGPGIPNHELDPVRNGQETPLSHGDGVGLWLVSWIVHSLEGSVDFDVENGSTVTITVPQSD